MLNPEFVLALLVLAIVVIGLLAVAEAWRRGHWETGASLIVVSLFFAALVFIHPAHAEFYGVGNIDLDARVAVINEDGSFSTEFSFSVEIDGLEVLLPTVINGKIVSEEDAIEHFLVTGEHLGMFPTLEEAEEYATWLHIRQLHYYSQQ